MDSLNSGEITSQLQTLSIQFNSILSQYTQTYQNYVNTFSISSMTNNMDTSTSTSASSPQLIQTSDLYLTFPKSSFWGKVGLLDISVNTVNDCLEKCISTTGCTGATFDNNEKHCWVRGGDGQILQQGQENYTAIIHKKIYYGYELQKLNKQLMEINKKMTELIQSNWTTVKDNQELEQIRREILDKNTAILQKEQYQIHSLIRENETLNAANQNSSILVSQNYFRFILFLIVVIILIILLVRILGMSSSSSSSTSYSSSQLGGMGKIKKLFHKLF